MDAYDNKTLEHKSQPAEKGSLLGNLKVLLVEDEELAREELSIFLKRRVGRLYAAGNGQEALAAFHTNKPDLVVTDLKMPVMGGMELIAKIRSAGFRCPVIVVSAMSDIDTILQAVDLGIVKYAIKPLNTNELVQLMETIAVDILKNQQGETVTEGGAIISREDKKELEKSLKGDIANFLKTFTGKGPRDINVFIHGNCIEVKASGVLTAFEGNLVKAGRNYSMVDYNRNIFYEENKQELEKKLEETLHTKVRLQQAHPDSAKDMDEIMFEIL